MKIGIRNGSLPFPEMTELFEQAARLGFDGIEIDVTGEEGNDPLLDEAGRAEIQQLIESTGVQVPSLCMGAFWVYRPASPDQALVERSRELLKEAIEAAVDLGSKWILIPVTPAGEPISKEEAQERWIRELRLAAPVAEEAGVVLALENVGGPGQSAEDLTTLTDGIGSPNVMAYYDIGNACFFGYDAVEEIESLAELIGVVHIKDIGGGDLLGQGMVNIPACVDTLRRVGYDGWLILETPPTEEPLEAGNYNLAFLRDIVD